MYVELGLCEGVVVGAEGAALVGALPYIPERHVDRDTRQERGKIRRVGGEHDSHEESERQS